MFLSQRSAPDDQELGILYAAHNGAYLGRGTALTLRLLPAGTTFSDRAAQKIRWGEQGWRYAVNQLARAGASLGSVRHPGNHQYAWTLQLRTQARLPPSLPCPKQWR